MNALLIVLAAVLLTGCTATQTAYNAAVLGAKRGVIAECVSLAAGGLGSTFRADVDHSLAASGYDYRTSPPRCE